MRMVQIEYVKAGMTLIKQKFKKIINYVLRVNIEVLKTGRGREANRYTYQHNSISFEIKNGEKILDIGSGGDPFPLATHLADCYENETTHRSAKLKRDTRPFIMCSIEATPFQDKEFDFVYCSHVLEHVDNPAKACKELMRIGKRGYIETPTRTSDIMFNFTRLQNHHKWYIQLAGNTLIFIEWKSAELRDVGTDYFLEQFHSRWKNPFQSLIHNNRDLFVNMFLWKDQFDYIVINKEGKIIKASAS